MLPISLCGAWLVKRQGVGTLARMRAELDDGRVPTGPMTDGGLLAAAGFLLLVPGFVTDVFGLRCWSRRCARRAPLARPPVPGAHRRAHAAVGAPTTSTSTRRPGVSATAGPTRPSSCPSGPGTDPATGHGASTQAPQFRRSSSGATGQSTRRRSCSGRTRPVGPAMRSATCTSSSSRPWSSGSPRRAQHRLEQSGRQHPAHARPPATRPARAGELGEAAAVPSATSTSVGARRDHLDEEVRGFQRGHFDEVDRAGLGVAAGEPGPPPLVTSPWCSSRTASASRSGRRASASPVAARPAEHRDGMVGREGEQARRGGRRCGRRARALRRPTPLPTARAPRAPARTTTTAVPARDGGAAGAGR